MSMDQSTGSERERIVQQERADARERVRVAQEHETSVREVKQLKAHLQGQQAQERQRQAAQEARTPDVTNATAPPDVPAGDE